MTEDTAKDVTENLIFFGGPTCGRVPAVREALEQFSVVYQYVDIARDAEGRQRVREINRGYESVPTLVFPDGSTLTEPSTPELKAKLGEFGYDSGAGGRAATVQRILGNPIVLLAAGIVLIVGIILPNYWLLNLGAIVLVLGLLARWLQRGRAA